MKITKKMLHAELERCFGADSVTMQRLRYEDLLQEVKEGNLWVVTIIIRKPHVHLYAVSSSRGTGRRRLYDLLRLLKPNLPEML